MNIAFLSTIFCFLGLAFTLCDSPSPAFPLPDFERHETLFLRVRTKIEETVVLLSQKEEYNKTSFSLEVTSQSRSLFGIYHTAKIRSKIHRGAERITNETNYRIASITKPFTVLALLQLQKQGKLDLDASILAYVPELDTSQSGSLPWKDITIRALATQMAGIPRDMAQDDLAISPDLAAQLGLPKVSKVHGPSCDALANYTRACNITDLLAYVKTLKPVFAPNQKSSYSNINYDLLGVVIANISGTSYDKYVVTKVLHEIGMKGSSFKTPPDSVAAIPAGIEYYWPFEIGAQQPTGGLYSSSGDMSRFVRYVLSTYNAQARGVNWFNPTSFSGSIDSFYGMPWEMFRKRTNEVALGLESTRPLTFITKGGGLPGYTSNIIMMPEYGLGITILVAGNGKAMSEIREIVTKELVIFAEAAAAAELQANYAGTYESDNVTIVVSHSKSQGLFISSWKTNGVDTMKGIASIYGNRDPKYQVLNLAPTLLFEDEKEQAGERWRILPQSTDPRDGRKEVFDNFCISDWDFFMFDGKPINELVFWRGKGSAVNRAALTGFGADLERKRGQQTTCEDHFEDVNRLVKQTIQGR